MPAVKRPRHSKTLFLQQPINKYHPLNFGLVGEWAAVPGLMGGKTIYDLVRGWKVPNDGTLTSMTTGSSGWNSSSHTGGYGSIQFDRTDDYVTTGKVFTYSGGVTVAWWANPSTAPNAGNVRAWWGHLSSNSTPEFSAQIFSDNNFYVGFNSPDKRVTLAASSSNAPQNVWSFYTYTAVSGGAATLYRNGSSIGTNAGPVTFVSPTGTFDIGRLGTAGGKFYGGSMNGIALWNSRALSAAEVYALYVETSTGNRNRWNWVTPRGTPPAATGGPWPWYFDAELSGGLHQLGL